MSGTNLADQAQDAARPTTNAAASEDYAASLRAAALMTLKSKRRKATAVHQAEPMLPHRSLAEPPSIELDYGQEEPIGASSIASSPAVAPAKPATPPPPIAEPMDVDDSAAREEGEISESEMAPPTPKAKPEPLSPVLEKSNPLVAQKPTVPRAITPPPVLPAAPAALPLLPHETVPSAMPVLVDENHVRPGLALTQAQYDTAKDIILDLLGWGVPPEYLVNCGLSREMVYYVFVELNLRLPANLDTTGLPPVPLPSASQVPQPSKRASLSHPSLPPKPQPSTEVSSLASSAPRSLSATAVPFIPSGSDATSSSAASSASVTLNDMEQQRRQELLARKAVLASRKSKQKGTASSPHTAAGHSTAKEDRTAAVPPKLVDDFLQSIEPPASTGLRSNGSESLTNGSSHRPPSRGLYDMDIDDVPGLTSRHEPITEYTPLRRPPPPPPPPKPAPILATPPSPVAPRSAVSSASDRSYPPSSTFSFSGTSLSYGGDDDMDVVPGLFQTPTPPDDDKPSQTRRGTKRPVAADFVDMEPGPSKGQGRGPPDFFRANIRRKTAGFAGLTQRRCVIDLSDSEDDGMDYMKQVAVPSRTDSRGPKAATPQTTAAPTPRQHSPAVTPAIAPSILQEKEEEIRRMRELIAQREQNRKKKLAASSRSTPSSSATPTNGVVNIKQEDDESAGVRSLRMSRSSSSATPDPTSNGRPYDSQDERSVLDALLPHGT
ncbi:hypothetical protein OH77DRAFT_1398850 [Trametes cingulata]|nr:hypothetical protein OH77DRAFT_1398850 [Trametes cingulata]